MINVKNTLFMILVQFVRVQILIPQLFSFNNLRQFLDTQKTLFFTKRSQHPKYQLQSSGFQYSDGHISFELSEHLHDLRGGKSYRYPVLYEPDELQIFFSFHAM